MYNLEKVRNTKPYEFRWEVQGYDCYQNVVKSPVFRVNFEVTEWQLELDFSNFQDVTYAIPCRLKRTSEIGPRIVTFDIALAVKQGSDEVPFEVPWPVVKSFEYKDSFDFEICIPPRLGVPDWMSSKSLFIHLKMQRSQPDREFTKGYWYSEKSLKAVEENLKSLYSEGSLHDVAFEVHGKEFKVHKCILKARWPQLASTLKFSKASSEVDTQALSSVSPELLEKLLMFAYCGDSDFMYNLDEIDPDIKVFDLVKTLNFYRLNNSITQLSPVCDSTQMFQSYRTSVEMAFADVEAAVGIGKPLGDFRTCDIPLKPRHLPPPDNTPRSTEGIEKFQRHIRFMDIRLYVDKGPLGYNWLMYSIVLGKIPEKTPVTIICKLYATEVNGEKIFLLSEQTHVFDKSSEISITTPFAPGKTSFRYQVFSSPVITWDDLMAEKKRIVKTLFRHSSSKKGGQSEEASSSKKGLSSEEGSSSEDHLSEEGTSSKKGRLSKEGTSSKKGRSSEDSSGKKYILFRFELKLSDGEYIHDERHGECIFEYKWDHKLFEDLRSMCNDKTYADVMVTSAADDKIKFEVHRAILAVRSSVLRGELEGKPNFPLKLDVEPDCLEMFIHYLYTGLLPEVASDKIAHLREVADRYEMECLKDVLDNQVNKTNGSATNGSARSN